MYFRSTASYEPIIAQLRLRSQGFAAPSGFFAAGVDIFLPCGIHLGLYVSARQHLVSNSRADPGLPGSNFSIERCQIRAGPPSILIKTGAELFGAGLPLCAGCESLAHSKLGRSPLGTSSLDHALAKTGCASTLSR